MYKRIALATVFGIVVFTVFYLAQKNLETFENATVSQTQNQLLAIGKSKAQYIEGIFRDVQVQLISLASNPIIKKRIKENISSEEIPNDAYCPTKIARMYLDNAVGSFYRIDSKGVVQTRIPNKKNVRGKNFSEKPDVKFLLQHYNSVGNKGQEPLAHISEIFFANSGRKAVSVCVSVIEQNRFIGMLRALIYLDDISDFLSFVNTANKGVAWMVNEKGLLLTHPEQDLLGVDLVRARSVAIPEHDWSALERIIERMVESQQGVGSFHEAWWDDGRMQVTKQIAAFVPVRVGKTAWSLAVSMSYDEVAGPIGIYKKRIAGIAALSVLVVIAMAGFLLRLEKRKTRLEIEAQAANRLKSVNEKLKGEIVERKRVEKALTKNEKHLKSIIDAIGVGIVIVDADTHVISEVNPVAAKLINASRAEIVGHMCHKFICPAEKGKCPVDNLHQKVEGSEKVLLTAGGEQIPILKTVAQIETGQGAVLVESFTDIRQLKQTQERLLESKKNLQRTFDKAPVGAALLSLDNKILRVNEALCLMVGYASEELVGFSLSDLIHPQDREDAKLAWKPLIAGQTDQCEIEKRCVRRDESVVWLRISLGLIRDESGNPSYIVPMMENITGQKKAMEELENREELFRTLTNLIPSGIVMTNVHGYCQYVNRGWIKRTGLSFQDSEGDGWIKGIHPEDQEHIASKFDGEQDTSNTVMKTRCRVMKDLGDFSEMEFRTITINDNHGEITGYMATIS